MGSDPRLSRRSMLGGLVAVAAAGLAGCTRQAAPAPDTITVTRGPTPRPPDQDDLSLVIDAIADEERLLGYCVAVARRHPSSRDVVGALRTRQRDHVMALRAALAHADPAPATDRAAVPAATRRAEASLVQRVVHARDARFDDCLAATSGLLARQLASMSASHAASADTLAAERAGG